MYTCLFLIFLICNPFGMEADYWDSFDEDDERFKRATGDPRATLIARIPRILTSFLTAKQLGEVCYRYFSALLFYAKISFFTSCVAEQQDLNLVHMTNGTSHVTFVIQMSSICHICHTKSLICQLCHIGVKGYKGSRRRR